MRYTYICLHVLDGADIYQVAENGRTTVEMIERHYAAEEPHTASALNGRNARRPRQNEASDGNEAPDA